MHAARAEPKSPGRIASARRNLRGPPLPPPGGARAPHTGRVPAHPAQYREGARGSPAAQVLGCISSEGQPQQEWVTCEPGLERAGQVAVVPPSAPKPWKERADRSSSTGGHSLLACNFPHPSATDVRPPIPAPAPNLVWAQTTEHWSCGPEERWPPGGRHDGRQGTVPKLCIGRWG